MKESRCFYCQQLEHTTANYPKSFKKVILVVEIMGTVIDNNKISGKE